MDLMILLLYEVFELLVFVDDRISEELIVYYVITSNHGTIILLLLLQ